MKKIAPILLLGSLTVAPLIGVTYASEASSNTNSIQQQYRISFECNGGKEVPSIIYIEGDNSIQLPKPKKSGFVFAGWYLDSDLNEPFYLNSTKVSQNITLYAKWVIKQVKVYLDTANPNEFEPLIYNVGDTFHLSSLPSLVKNKESQGLSFSFKQWVRGNELPATEDFVLEDTYYEFHATYGGIDTSLYNVTYENNFDTPYGYIDNEHSWTRGELTLPKAGIGEASPTQGVFLKSDSLSLNQLTYDGLKYGAKALLPKEFTDGLRKYSIETTFRIAKTTNLSKASSKSGDAGFGIMVGYNYETGANVEAVVDPNSNMVRIAGLNSLYQNSSTDVNKSFSYNVSSSLSEYHRLKIVFDGETLNEGTTYTNSTMEVYFDDVKAFSTKTTALKKNWFTAGQASGDGIGLCANLCEADVAKVSLKSFDETSAIYEKDFTSNVTTFDGWSYIDDSNGANVGEVSVKDGKLDINSYFPSQSIKKHQAIYSPASSIKDFAVSFDFSFANYSDIDKYLGFMFRGNGSRYNAIFFRSEKGNVQLYKHGLNDPKYSDWSSGIALKTISGGFNKENHHVDIIVKGDYLYVKIDGNEIYSSITTSGSLLDESGKIGFLTSASEVLIDNLTIYNLETKEASK